MPDAPTLHTLEPDPERAREIAERGLILRTTVGSVVHGLSNPGTDDRDELGVCIEPLSTGRLAAELEAASRAEGLREQSDVDAVDRFVVRAYRAAWDAG